MTTQRPFPAAVDFAVLVLAVLALMAMGHHEVRLLEMLHLLMAMALINLLDVALPHGDSVDIDSALILASIYMIGPFLTFVIVVIGRTIAHLFAHGLSLRSQYVSGLARRAAGLVTGGLVWTVLTALWSDAHVWRYWALLLSGLAFVLTELFYGQLRYAYARGDSPMRTAMSNLLLQGPLLASSVSVAVLTVMVYQDMGIWGLALMGFLLLAMRQSFALLLDIRSSYHDTIEALIGAMEAQRPGDRGLGGQIAMLARRAGAEYGWYGPIIESLGYAALLFHFDLDFVQTGPDGEHAKDTPLAEVTFFEPVEPILTLLAGRDAAGVSRRDAEAAYLVAKALAVFGEESGAQRATLLRRMIEAPTANRIDNSVATAAMKTGLI